MRNRGIARSFAAVVAIASVITVGGRTFAATATADIAVSASVTNNCTISTQALAFGSYDPVVANATANLDGTGRVTVACTKGALATIGLGTGGNAAGSSRRLADGSGNYLTYELYQDSSRSSVWNTGAGLLSMTPAPTRAARDFSVYGRIPGAQDVPAGSYADTVVATVNF
jgi:spore coat protein U-like protein